MLWKNEYHIKRTFAQACRIVYHTQPRRCIRYGNIHCAAFLTLNGGLFWGDKMNCFSSVTGVCRLWFIEKRCKTSPIKVATNYRVGSKVCHAFSWYDRIASTKWKYHIMIVLVFTNYDSFHLLIFSLKGSRVDAMVHHAFQL